VNFNVGDALGDYQVVAVLGKGGMGEVYQVRNVISTRLEAMKVLLADLESNSEAAERFMREIQVLAGLDHPNIAALRTAQRFRNQLLMIMEFVPGTTLMAKLQNGEVTLADGINYVCQALSALTYAHGQGVVHRDIKPANLIITPDGKVKLMDFGIAKTVYERSLTSTGTTLGSVHYMSPEQVVGGSNALDGRSDLYSVGVVLYEIATRRRPFEAKSDYAVMTAQVQSAPVPPIDLNPTLSAPLNLVILKALAKEASQRYQTADEFLTDLQSLNASTPQCSYVSASLATDKYLTQSAVAELDLRRTEELTQGSRRAWTIVIGCTAIAVITLLLWLWLHRTPTRALSLPSGDMVLVDAGEALLGRDRKTVKVEGFYIDKTEVTNRAFLAFCHETNSPLPPRADVAPADNPVTDVTYDEAQAFARWAKKRLPTAIEWEKAARGPKGLTYPWGDSLDYNLANIPRYGESVKARTLAPAVSYSEGASPYGALNMVGNVAEWIEAPATAPTGNEFSNYQTTFRDLTPPLLPTEPFYQVRGGSYLFVLESNEEAARLLWDSTPVPARARMRGIGFRCAKSLGR
jgi:serine/threonine protein kinase/formylglycine-generating enzyme required for sulfatase activity